MPFETTLFRKTLKQIRLFEASKPYCQCLNVQILEITGQRVRVTVCNIYKMQVYNSAATLGSRQIIDAPHLAVTVRAVEIIAVNKPFSHVENFRKTEATIGAQTSPRIESGRKSAETFKRFASPKIPVDMIAR